MSQLSAAAVARLRSALALNPVPPRYRLLEVIGEGGMGVVWRAQDTLLSREVAVKVLAPHLDGTVFVARMAHEARILAALEHPGIVPVFDLGSDEGGSAWYAMRLVRGVRLDTAAHEGRGRRDLLRIVEDICDTVAYAHAHGVAHRDLKPGNVMLGPFGEVLVLDWGVAGDDTAVSEPGVVVGTPGFMAPEQLAGERGDMRADIYGIGAIIREMVSAHASPVPRPLASIIARACAADPARRYGSALELRDDLRRFAAGERVLAHKESSLERVARFVTTYRTPILLILAYLVMRIAILAWRGI